MLTLPDSDITIADFFAGAGGSSQGARRVPGVRLKLAVNHWRRAVETHSTNFPDAEHDCVDLQTTDPRRYQPCRMVLISPDCRRHSKGSGAKRNDRRQLSFWDGGPVDAEAIRSRATMHEVIKVAEAWKPDVIIVENVVEVTRWDEFEEWYKTLTQKLKYPYYGQTLCLNSMFFPPTPQSRDRIYFVFTRQAITPPDLSFTPPGWCERCSQVVEAIQSWKPRAKLTKIGKYKQQYLYLCPRCSWEVTPFHHCAAEVVDFRWPAGKIGERTKPLTAKTLARIKLGLSKFAHQSWLLGVGGPRGQHKAYPLSAAYPTQTSVGGLGLVAPPFVPQGVQTETDYYSPHPANQPANGPLTQPGPGLTQSYHQALEPVTPLPFQVGTGRTVTALRTVDGPYPIQTTCQNMGVVLPAPALMIEMYRTGSGRSLLEAISTVTAGGNHHGLLSLPFCSSGYFLASYYGTDTGHALSEPIPTVPTLDKHALVGASASLSEALATPSHQTSLNNTATAIQVEDCTFRMLQPHEIGRAMAFEPDYVVLGNKREQVRQYGQAVTPPVMEWLVSRCVQVLG